MSNAHVGNIQPTIDLEEHRTVNGIPAKAVIPYVYDGTSISPQQPGLLNVTYDDIEFTNADANGNYQLVTFSKSAITVATLTLAFDANSHVTSIVKT